MYRRFAHLTVITSAVALGLALLAAPVEGSAEGLDSTAATPSTERDGKPKRFCRGHRATIVGTSRADWILGTKARDVIWAGRGADTVAALDGRDLVCGGPGVDALEGGAGRDRLYGDRGRDLCTGEDREHRHHHSCEAHLDVFGYEVDPPDAPDDGDRDAVRAEATVAADVPAALRGGAYFTSDSPVCAPDGMALTTVRLGNVYFKTYYTNPGYIAIRPAYFRVGDSGFMQGPFYDGAGAWTQLYAPADDTVYSYDMYGATVPRGDRVFWVYEVFWWNGFEWTNFEKFAVPGHYLQTTTGPLYTGVCWV